MRRLLVFAGLLALTGCTVTLPSARNSPAQTTPAPQVSVSPVQVMPPGSLSLGGLQAQFTQVVKEVLPSVVQIETDQGLGSGIVFDQAGDVVTNYHVVSGATSFKVTLSDGRGFNGALVGSYQAGDLAVIRISASGLHPAAFADSSKVVVGDIVLAIGNPLGLRSSVTEGIVSAFRSAVPEGNGVTLPAVIQTSAAINPGNSGGALVDLDGQVVGIPTLAAVDPELGGTAAGIGFAIASNTVVDIANQLVQTGHVTNTHRAYLGVRIGNASGGVYVSSVVAGGPADKAGIVAGDVITSVAGQATPDTATLAQVLAGLSPGQTVPVAVTQASGGTATVQVTLGTLPA
ncbi:MAG TPA: trypsin-like peptidase domain-containing protein [Candidatus Dormibacteraeota bacterium]